MTLTHDTDETLSITEANLGPDELEHGWRTALRERLTTIELRPTGRYGVIPKAEFYDLGDVKITDWDCPDAEGFRNRRMVERDADALLVFTAFEGTQILETKHESLLLRPGDVLAMTTRTTGKVVVPDRLRKRTARIPLAALAPFDTGPGIPDTLMFCGRDNPLAGLAHDYLMGVGSRIGDMSPIEIEGARNALLVLTAGMIRATRPSDIGAAEFLPHLRQQLEDWIVQHLALGAIRVRDLAAAHNVASRTVHRAFAATGDTVGSVVRSHRISAARSDLVNTAASVAAIAHRWGFCDASHLGREFRREFSMSPGEYREAYAAA